MSEKKSLKIKIEISVDPLHSEYLKDILKVVSKDKLGDYFIAFLKEHTINELSNGDTYHKRLVYEVATNVASVFSAKFEDIIGKLGKELTSNSNFIDKLTSS